VTTNAQRDPVVRAAGLQRLARTYLAERAPCDDPSASPLFADLSGLPPCLVQVGRNELLRSDSTELVEALLRQGVNASLDLREDMFHGFYVMDELPEAQQALAHVSRFVNERFAAFHVTSQA
jgi:acetyl esterase/lipase